MSKWCIPARRRIFSVAVLAMAGLALAEATLAENASVARSQPASQPSQAASAPSAWPPGLLMEGLGNARVRKALDDLGIRAWGFAEAGFTGRLIGGQDVLFGRVFEARRPNNLRLNQVRLTVDRPYDTQKPFDIGGRIDGLFGGDAKITHALGLFDKAGEGAGDAWADMVQAYGQAWFKTGPESGLEATVGKFVTTHGVEVIDATGNPLYSHSYLFGFAIPFTHTGVKLNYVFNPQASVYFAVIEGWDDFKDNNNAPSYMAGGSLSSKEQVEEGKARTQGFFNIITGPEQPDDVNSYRTVVDGTLTYWWTGRLSESINADIGHEPRVPGIGNATWYGLAHYLTYVFNDHLSGTWRAEWFRDEGGSRIGADGAFYENTWGLTITPWPANPVLKGLAIRPELRWDFSDKPAFGDGRHHQLTLGLDVIFKF